MSDTTGFLIVLFVGVPIVTIILVCAINGIWPWDL